MPARLIHDSLSVTSEAHPDKAALSFAGETHSYAELQRAAMRLARGLQELGLERGDRVAIYLADLWLGAVSIYGVLAAGGVIVVVNPQTKPVRLAGLLSDSGARALVTDDDLGYVEVPTSLRWVLGTARERVAGREVISLEGLLERSAGAPLEPGTIPLDLAALIYTSGSTGRPKGVMMTHQSMVFVLGSVLEYLRLGADDRILSTLPLAYSYGLYQLFASVTLGATLLLERSFAYPAHIVERIREERVSVFPGVPTMFAALLALRGQSGLSLPGVRCITTAAAALPAPFAEPLTELFPAARIYQMYGQTECKRASYLEPELFVQRPTSVGKAIPGTELLLLSDEGKPVAAGETGTLHVRGPHVMLGYWGQPERTAETLKEGRFPGERILCTFDRFTMDAEGFFYFVGRSDDIIVTRGEKVSPLEIENVLNEIPGVRLAAVIGVPHESLGHSIRALVTAVDGASLSEREIRRYCQARLESFKVPSEVVVLDEFPQTTSGKVLKSELRDRYGHVA